MPDPAPHPLRDQVTLLLVNGQSPEAVERFCVSRGADLATVRELISDARKRITVSADYSRDEQIATAVRRLNDIYSKATSAKEYRIALAAQKDLSRLLGLYATNQDAGGPAGATDESSSGPLQLVAQYLKPLKLIHDRYPVEEHARVAAELLRGAGLAKL